jgi:hypothetical protein
MEGSTAPEPKKPESMDTGICLAAAMALRFLLGAGAPLLTNIPQVVSLTL